MKAKVYFKSAVRMAEVPNASADLLIGASVYLGKGVSWDRYAELYQQVYNTEGRRILKPDGYFVVLQTNAYIDGAVLPRHALLLDLLLPAGWRLLDEKIWLRCGVNFFQPPFSHVMVFGRGKTTRAKLKYKPYLRGLWDYPQTRGSDKAGYPDGLCELLLRTFTKRGNSVVDPFAGTGRLLGMAAAHGRTATGYEIDEAMVSILQGNNCEVVR